MNPMNLFNGMGGGINPMQLIQMIQKGGNPMQIMQSVMGNNPQYQRVMRMVEGKSPQEIKQVAANLCQQRGIDFDQAVNQMRQMGINIPDDPGNG